jgi:hypothetical protein
MIGRRIGGRPSRGCSRLRRFPRFSRLILKELFHQNWSTGKASCRQEFFQVSAAIRFALQ